MRSRRDDPPLPFVNHPSLPNYRHTHKPNIHTKINHQQFTDPDALNLIVIKSSRLEVHSLGPEGLTPVRFFGI